MDNTSVKNASKNKKTTNKITINMNNNYPTARVLLEEITAKRLEHQREQEREMQAETKELEKLDKEVKIFSIFQKAFDEWTDDEIADMLSKRTYGLNKRLKAKAQYIMQHPQGDMSLKEIKVWLNENAPRWEEEIMEYVEPDNGAAEYVEPNQNQALLNMEAKQRQQDIEQWRAEQPETPRAFYLIINLKEDDDEGVRYDSRKSAWKYIKRLQKRIFDPSLAIFKNMGQAKAKAGELLLKQFAAREGLTPSRMTRKEKGAVVNKILRENNLNFDLNITEEPCFHNKAIKTFPTITISLKRRMTVSTKYYLTGLSTLSKLTDEEIELNEERPLAIQLVPLTLYQLETETIKGKTDNSEQVFQDTNMEAAFNALKDNPDSGQDPADRPEELEAYFNLARSMDKEDVMSSLQLPTPEFLSDGDIEEAIKDGAMQAEYALRLFPDLAEDIHMAEMAKQQEFFDAYNRLQEMRKLAAANRNLKKMRDDAAEGADVPF